MCLTILFVYLQIFCLYQIKSSFLNLHCCPFVTSDHSFIDCDDQEVSAGHTVGERLEGQSMHNGIPRKRFKP